MSVGRSSVPSFFDSVGCLQTDYQFEEMSVFVVFCSLHSLSLKEIMLEFYVLFPFVIEHRNGYFGKALVTKWSARRKGDRHLVFGVYFSWNWWVAFRSLFSTTCSVFLGVILWCQTKQWSLCWRKYDLKMRFPNFQRPYAWPELFRKHNGIRGSEERSSLVLKSAMTLFRDNTK